jgi:carboxylesterase
LGTVWDLHVALTRRLLLWSGGSILAGILALLLGGAFWQAFGIQATAWGTIDAAIALLGRRASLRRWRAYADPELEEVLEGEAQKLSRLLWINTGLDVLYVTGGMAMVLTLGRSSVRWLGHGWGIVVQGGFLFSFDLIHAQSVPVTTPRGLARLYQGTKHAPFTWPAGKPAALLVHGFLGSPAEIRPLARALHQAGWTVRGVLLPGHGPDIETLPERRHEDWLAAVDKALAELQREHSPVLLIGYSMGGALSVVSATRRPPDALILLAPFVHLTSPLLEATWTVLRPVLPRYVRPLRRADLGNAHLRASIAEVLPDLDLDDANVQSTIRQAAVPVSVLLELRKSGQQAHRYASSVTAPTYIIQGKHDDVARPKYTRRLARRLMRQVGYTEIDAGHRLVYRSEPGWPQVEGEVVRLANAALKEVTSRRGDSL